MKTTTQTIRFQRLGCCPSSKFRLVNDDTMNADDEIVVAKKMKHEMQYKANTIILNGKVEITVATTAACPCVFKMWTKFTAPVCWSHRE